MNNFIEWIGLMWDWFDNKPLPLRVWYTLELACDLTLADWRTDRNRKALRKSEGMKL